MSNNEIELQALISEREAMIAENMQRNIMGQSMAYNEANFFFIAESMRSLKTEE